MGFIAVVGNSPRTRQVRAGTRSRRRSFLRRAIAGPGRLGERESVYLQTESGVRLLREAGNVCST